MPATDLLAASGGQTYEGLFSFTATVDPASIGAVGAGNTTVTVPSGVTLLATDTILAVPPAALEAGVAVQGAYYASATTLTLRLTNASAGAIDPASATWTFIVLRK
jgi:hypothetical protein